MEAAGVVLGGFTIALYALDNYKRGLNAIKDVVRYEMTLETFRLHVFVQQAQLKITLQSIGIYSGNGPLPTKIEVKSHLQHLYPNNCDKFMGILARMDCVLAKLLDKLDVDSRGKPKWTPDPLQRAAWNWRRIKRGLGGSERDELVRQLQYWNTTLATIFEQAEIPQDVDGPLVQKLQAQFNPKGCSAIRNNAHCIYDALAQAWQCDCPEHRASLALSWHVDNTTTVGPLRLAMSSHDGTWQSLTAYIEQNQNPVSLATQALLSPSQSAGSTTSRRSRRMVSFSPSRGRHEVESINLVESRIPLKPAPPTTEVTSLCNFISNQVRSETWSIQVADVEETTSSHRRLLCLTHPVSRPGRCVVLNEFLRPENRRQPAQQTPGAIYPLSRRERFAIASAATWAVLYLCGTPWLRDNWSGSHAVELSVEVERNQAHSAEPSISCVLKSQHDIPAGDDHEQDTQIGRVRNRALFTLGILLTELCLDTTLASLRQQQCDNSFAWSLGVTTTEVDDYELANQQSERVYLEAGESFGYAVQRCLRCEFPGRDSQKDFDFEEFRRHFFRGVVAPVHSAYLLQCR